MFTWFWNMERIRRYPEPHNSILEHNPSYLRVFHKVQNFYTSKKYHFGKDNLGHEETLKQTMAFGFPFLHLIFLFRFHFWDCLIQCWTEVSDLKLDVFYIIPLKLQFYVNPLIGLLYFKQPSLIFYLKWLLNWIC